MRKKDSVSTKNDLIQSAIDVIEEKGYSKTTLEDIVKRIGMTRGAFYWHFQDKSDILNEILERYRAFYDNNEAKKQELASAHDTLRNYIIQLMKTKIESPNDLAFLFRYKVEAANDAHDLIGFQRTMDDHRIEYIIRQIRRGIEQGEFNSKIVPEAAAMCIYSFILGFDNYMMLHWTKDFRDERIDDINIFKQADLIMKTLD